MIDDAEYAESIRRSRIAVTGANGFVGSHVVSRLVALGASVTAVVRPGADLWRLSSVAGQIETLIASPADLGSGKVVDRLRGTTVLIHLAAAGTNQSEHDAEAVLDANVVGTFRVVQLAQRLQVSRTILAGSGHEYGLGSRLSEEALTRPRTVYAASKAAGSLFAHTFAFQTGVEVVTLRMFSLYGSGQARHFLIPAAAMAAVKNAPILLRGAEQRRDYVFIDDAVRAFVRAAFAPGIGGETLNVTSGSDVRIGDLVTLLVQVAGSVSEVRLLEQRLERTELPVCSGDPERSARRLGWRVSTPLEDGLRKTIEWFREHQDSYERHYPDCKHAQ